MKSTLRFKSIHCLPPTSLNKEPCLLKYNAKAHLIDMLLREYV